MVFARLVCAALLAALTATAAQAESTQVIINGDSGGQIIDYAMRYANYQRDKSKVRFEGRCDSACTMFLALPSNQTCLSPGAYFRFHSPYGGTEQQDAIAADILMEKYPEWVKSWIAENGHLTDKLIKMDYDHAKKFLKPCAQTVAGF
jgi:hypothetical protein